MMARNRLSPSDVTREFLGQDGRTHVFPLSAAFIRSNYFRELGVPASGLREFTDIEVVQAMSAGLLIMDIGKVDQGTVKAVNRIARKIQTQEQFDKLRDVMVKNPVKDIQGFWRNIHTWLIDDVGVEYDDLRDVYGSDNAVQHDKSSSSSPIVLSAVSQVSTPMETTATQIASSPISVTQVSPISSSLAKIREIHVMDFASSPVNTQSVDLSKTSREHDALFIHSIQPNYVPGINSILQAKATWKTKLDILLSLRPNLSVSSIREGDSYQKMYGRMGVILRNGNIHFASPTDTGSKAKTLDRREVIGMPTGDLKYLKENVSKAILSNNERYNEFGVIEPEVAGYYVNIEQTDYSSDWDLVSPREIVSKTKEWGLPLYVIQNGIPYESIYDETSDKLKAGRRITIPEILSNSYQTPADKVESTTQQIFKDSPFKINPPEVRYIDSYQSGQGLYFDLTGNDNVDRAGQIVDIELQNGFKVKVVQAREIADIPKFGSPFRTKYFVLQDKDGLARLIKEIVSPDANIDGLERKTVVDVQKRLKDISVFGDPVQLAGGNLFGGEKKVWNVPTYLEAMRAKLTDFRGRYPINAVPNSIGLSNKSAALSRTPK